VQDGRFVLDIQNHGSVGVVLGVRTLGGSGPWFYTVEAGKRLDDRLPLGAAYDFEVHGPNGFLREFRDTAPYTFISADCRYDDATGELVFVVRNHGAEARKLVMQGLGYDAQEPRIYQLAPGSTIGNRWAIASSGHWYDIELRSGSLVRRWAGHIETGRDSHSDPALGGA
jgi:phospholipase C